MQPEFLYNVMILGLLNLRRFRAMKDTVAADPRREGETLGPRRVAPPPRERRLGLPGTRRPAEHGRGTGLRNSTTDSSTAQSPQTNPTTGMSKHILVTGGNSGIGFALCKQLVTEKVLEFLL